MDKRARIEEAKEKTIIVLEVLFMLGIVMFCLWDLAIHRCINEDIEQLKVKQEQLEQAAKVENEKQYEKFGVDDRIFEDEVSLDWSKSDLNFQPIKCKLDEDTQEFAYYIAEAYNIDFSLIMAIMKVESNYKPDTVSSTNDYGLMQINKCNHAMLKDKLGINDFLDPEQNIRAGCYILRKLFEKYKDVGLVLMAYNMGESGASKLWDAGICLTEYSRKVLKAQAKIERSMGRESD